ncbi:MAG: hypothetical protein COA78_36175 [Blastopirellula sp.]|nr:MAG: hypothetical protein COA78_36175 [Blastopirellula sp.]
MSESNKEKWKRLFSKVPEDIREDVSQLIYFDYNTLVNNGVLKETAQFLSTEGFPENSAPFLSFSISDDSKIESLLNGIDDSTNYYPIGSNGSGDIIAVQKDNDNIVYFNHDDFHKKIFINSNIRKFFDSLYLFQESKINKVESLSINDFIKIDSNCNSKNSMWPNEVY